MKRFVYILLILLFGCKTVPTDNLLRPEPLLIYFNSDLKDDWLAGLRVMRENINDNFTLALFSIYLDDKYKGIRGDILPIIISYVKEFSIDYNDLFNMLKKVEDCSKLSDIIREFEDDEIVRYATTLFLSNTEFRSSLIEELGLKILEYNHVILLFNSDNRVIKNGVIAASGYMRSNNINPWLVQLLYMGDEEFSAAAVFSLSKHGSAGFSLLVDNLINLSDRLKLSSIDLLTYNKVYSVYEKFSDLLEVKNELIANRIFQEYTKLGKKALPYILSNLASSHIDYKIPLLKILESSGEVDYLEKIYYLLEYNQLKKYIVELYFQKNAINLIQNILLGEDEPLKDSVISYAVNNNSSLLFSNDNIKNLSLLYFLKNYDLEIAVLYFLNNNFDENFISDYKVVYGIFSGMNFLTLVESQNGEIDYISKYFEFEQRRKIADKELTQFFDGMENWLKSGDIDYLNKSLVLKNSEVVTSTAVDEEKSTFINSLEGDKRDTLLRYEITKKDIERNYRALTYRLKKFGYDLIVDMGYAFLIE